MLTRPRKSARGGGKWVGVVHPEQVVFAINLHGPEGCSDDELRDLGLTRDQLDAITAKLVEQDRIARHPDNDDLWVATGAP